MRRTLLLTLALPAVLLVSGAATQPQDESEPASVRGSAHSSVVAAGRPAEPLAGPQGGASDGAAELAQPSTGGPAQPAPAPDPPQPAPSRPTEESRRTEEPGTDPTLLTRAPLQSSEGFLVAQGGSISGTGPRWRYTIEVEPATGLDLDEVARDVIHALHDMRSWSASRTLEQVGDPASARIRLVVATPETVDRLCAEVGLRTAGIYSCWNGRFAALNAWRWEVGATGFSDMETYRTYLVNHEFGHGLGYGHVGCPATGATAPVMMQQSKDLEGCEPNGWPYP